MRASADLHRARAGQGGFTLLEIMITVGLIAVVLLPILGVREQSQAKVYRSTSMLEATRHAHDFLAGRLRNPASSDGEHGRIEGAPQFRYEFTLEDYDLSLGYSDDEQLQDRDGDGFPDNGYLPADAVAEEDQAEERTPHKWRRYELTLFWDSWDVADEEDSLVLEGFVPRVWEEQEDLLENDG